MGNSVIKPNSSGSKKKAQFSSTVGILSFESAKIMSRGLSLYKFLSDGEFSRLRTEVLRSEALAYFVSPDEGFLLSLACAELLEDLASVVRSISNLGRKCKDAALQSFEHIFNDLLRYGFIPSAGKLGPKFLSLKDWDRKVEKIEKYISLTLELRTESEVLKEMEDSEKKLQRRRDTYGALYQMMSPELFEQKLEWQRQRVKQLRKLSLWNCSHDKVAGLMAACVIAVYGRICSVFSPYVSGLPLFPTEFASKNGQISGQLVIFRSPAQLPEIGILKDHRASGPFEKIPTGHGILHSKSLRIFGPDTPFELDFSMDESIGHGHPLRKLYEPFPKFRAKYGGEFRETKFSTRGEFGETKTFTKNDGEFNDVDSNMIGKGAGVHSYQANRKQEAPLAYCKILWNGASRYGRTNKLFHASPSTVGGSALAFRYANVIIFVERLLLCPSMVREDARTDLYNMLPTSLKSSVRTKLMSYGKRKLINGEDLMIDEWKEAVQRIMEWLSPLAHDMIRWQTEHNHEQQRFEREQARKGDSVEIEEG
ncbi:uncharacterized protein LOC18436248 isoform X2 [Amborella trichopoda]|uniref:uncharacterized protein LOC18436248 isoform X2 n=1 Tax=Amborella trichopoda TaxID=13333 RepID=UPI0009BDF8BC|nr:uncharacterized protein LOC18436248 isoform X2 [Amborella trichopoda]|eukprot:XP_020523983.1 uncharacterized protein LOC18436248 isoform X2 [Amborella trichopoda]